MQDNCIGSGEVWKDVLGYEGFYQVSNLGRVRSIPRVTVRIGRKTKRKFVNKQLGKTLKPGWQKSGHLFVNLCKNNKVKIFRIHRLVLETFIGSCPNNKECCHNDGNPANNRLENLRWDTKKNNSRDTINHDKSNFRLGNRHPNSVLNEEKALEIKLLYKTGRYSHVKLGKLFGVSAGLIMNIVNNKSWHCRKSVDRLRADNPA